MLSGKPLNQRFPVVRMEPGLQKCNGRHRGLINRNGISTSVITMDTFRLSSSQLRPSVLFHDSSTRLLTRVTRRLSPVEQGLLILEENLSSTSFLILFVLFILFLKIHVYTFLECVPWCSRRTRLISMYKRYLACFYGCTQDFHTRWYSCISTVTRRVQLVELWLLILPNRWIHLWALFVTGFVMLTMCLFTRYFLLAIVPSVCGFWLPF